MRRFKLIFAIVMITSLGLLIPSYAQKLAKPGSAANLITDIEQSRKKLSAYLGEKDQGYKKITDGNLRSKVKRLCGLCGSISCKVMDVKIGCIEYCLRDEIIGCIKAKIPK